ncbi:hypothetical protein RvY_09298-2 [Ramazzottius varieornatus]|uniref:MABP1/WDR62 second WD40 domain-containing protein n=1 Tax=Ramazzottius varieornatus TaxID=947166 RepID=A0A1D1VGT3_RAMVA|nr:hypothetical protein RvY_09298-2 [Ramazzottius varieornatus]
MMPGFGIFATSKDEKLDGRPIQNAQAKRSASLWDKDKQKVLQAEHVLGLTVTSNASFAACPSTGLLAYTAGCTIVLYNAVTDLQRQLTVPNRRVLTTIAVCGKYIASGESGQVPCCRVFDTDTGNQLCELSGHKAVALVAFSPDGKYLISVGTQHDNLLSVWEWEAGRKVATNKISSPVKSISFASDGSYFVTVGPRLVRFWYMSAEAKGETLPLAGRSAVLEEMKDEVFCDVACGTGSHREYVYAITKSGFLCRFNNQRLLEHSTLLSVSEANCLAVSEHSVTVGCANGDVLTFEPSSLEPSGSLPLPHCLGSQGELLGGRVEGVAYPACVALAIDAVANHVAAIYNDHSLYVWDAQNPADLRLVSSQLFHSRCIWGLETYAPQSPRRGPSLPAGSFITCSSDDTVRIWCPSGDPEALGHNMEDFGLRPKCTEIIFNDPKFRYLCNSDNGSPGGIDAMDCSADGKYGVRCLKVDHHGEQLAFGDRLGFVHIYSLVEMRDLFKIEAHSSEVLCLDFSSPSSGFEYLASAGRDRLIQIFAVNDDFNCVQTLDEHTASVTALRFTGLNLISCGVDKKIVFWMLKSGGGAFELQEEVKSKGGVMYDMAVDEKTQSLITANQDRQLRTYSLRTQKPEKTTRGCAADEGAVVKMDFLDSKGLAATSCSDKSLSIVDVNTGECWGNVSGHSEIVTDLKFCEDEKRLLSVSGDSCVFLWRMDAEGLTTSSMDREVAPLPHIPLSPSTSNGYASDVSSALNEPAEERRSPVDKRPVKLNMNGMGLPSWAKKDSGKKTTPLHETAPVLPTGRWAQDVDLDRTGPSSFAFDVDHSSSSPKVSPGKKFTSMSRSSSRPSSRPASPATSASGKGVDGQPSAQSVETPQTSILGLLGKPRRPIRDELEDEEEEAEKEKAKEYTEMESSESASTFSAGTASPPSGSRPETPIGAANRFLHLNENGIDKLIKRRHPSRSAAAKPRAVEAVVPQQPAVERTAEAEAVAKIVSQVSPSRKLIQNAKLAAANRRKFQSTQNLSSGENSSTIASDFCNSTSTPSTQNALQGCSTDHNMRRATSMMNINSVSFGKENQSESEGYGSLLERAKARLSAISSKRQTDASASPRLLDMPDTRPADSPPIISQGGDHETDRKTQDEASLSVKFRPPRNSTSRSRSTDRGALALRSVSQSRNFAQDTEPASTALRPLSAIRLRLNSASRTQVPVNPAVNESPTAEAIARIKAGLGLVPKPENSEQVPEPPSAPEDSLRYKDCVKECQDLTKNLETVIQRLIKLNSGETMAERRDLQMTLCTEALSKVATQLAALPGTATAVVERAGTDSKYEMNGSIDKLSSSRRTSCSESPVQMII